VPEKIKLIGQSRGSFAFQLLEDEVNKWLGEFQGEIVDISFVSYPEDARMGDIGAGGWLVMIRYREAVEARIHN